MLKMSLDKVDVKIIEILQEQGDISNNFCGAREQGLKQGWNNVKNKAGTMSQKQGQPCSEQGFFFFQ